MYLIRKQRLPHLNFCFKSLDLYVDADRGVFCRLQWVHPRIRFCPFGRKQHLKDFEIYSHFLATLILESALSSLEGGRCLPPSWLRAILSWGIVWVPLSRILHFSLCGLMWSWSNDPGFLFLLFVLFPLPGKFSNNPWESITIIIPNLQIKTIKFRECK